jgi:hypothetical protein
MSEKKLTNAELDKQIDVLTSDVYHLLRDKIDQNIQSVDNYILTSSVLINTLSKYIVASALSIEEASEGKMKVEDNVKEL